MREIFRCANCGGTLKKPDARCNECGYSRRSESSLDTDIVYGVLLKNAGENPKLAGEVIQRSGSLSQDDWKTLANQLPGIVFETSSINDARVLAQKLQSVGADAVITKYTNKELLSDVDEKPAKRGSGSKINTLFTIFFIIIAIAGSLINRINPAQMEKWKSQYAERILAPINKHLLRELVVTNKEMKKGDRIKLQDLGMKKLPFYELPQDAVLVSDIQKVEGKIVLKDIPSGTVLVWTFFRTYDQ